MPILEVKKLVKTYGRKRVVNGVSFSVEAGESVGILGPNGAGKTTTFKMTCGMERPDEGSVILQGQDVTNWPMYRRAREGQMGYLPQDSSVFAKLSVEQNLTLMIELQGFQQVGQQQMLMQVGQVSGMFGMMVGDLAYW